MGAGRPAGSPGGGQPVGGLDVLGHLGGVGGGVAALGTLLLGHGHLHRDSLALDLRGIANHESRFTESTCYTY